MDKDPQPMSYIVLITAADADAVDRYVRVAQDHGDHLVAIEDGRVIREVAPNREDGPQ
jgi:hypothetical protein